MKPLPDLHQRAFTYKNHRRLKHDGGRSWIKDSQLYDARKGVNTYAVSTPADGQDGASPAGSKQLESGR